MHLMLCARTDFAVNSKLKVAKCTCRLCARSNFSVEIVVNAVYMYLMPLRSNKIPRTLRSLESL